MEALFFLLLLVSAFPHACRLHALGPPYLTQQTWDGEPAAADNGEA
jgi:hypothetical protein